MRLAGGVHLTYCSNIHPGETWGEVRGNLARHVCAVRDRVSPDAPFGVGLRLSAQAADELARPEVLAELQDFLARERLYVFTLNGFPYGTFHGQRVKEEVYLPDWRDPERLRYTNRLADLMAALLPAGGGDGGDGAPLEGSVSTVPGAFKPALGGEADIARMAEQLLQHVAHLVALRRRSGRVVSLALEPEPACFLETVDEVIDFHDRWLRTPAALARLGELAGLDADGARAALHTHLGLCLDLCHAAVEFEDPDAALDRLQAAGIRITKLQVSAGLRLPTLDEASLEALRGFQDAVYLHQVVERGPQGLVRHVDLPAAFAALPGPATDREWRVHFHVPIFLARLARFASTQDFVRAVLARQRRQPVSAHLEVETYTWDVLPAPYRAGSVDDAVARELAWVRTELGG